MSYSPSWTNANSQGRLTAGSHLARLADAQELASAINRRHLLAYQWASDFSPVVYSGAYILRSPLYGVVYPPFDNFRTAMTYDLVRPQVGGLGGSPASPTSMDWLWPIGGGDENKIIVVNNPVTGQVGLFDKLNGGSSWTDPTLTAGASGIRAVHHNELRQSIEWLSRGRWKMPIYFCSGIFSMLPDAPWLSGAVANNGTDELRGLGFAYLRGNDEGSGLSNVTARSGGVVELTADTNCTVALYHCRRTLRFASSPPTWNKYDPLADLAWSAAGGTGGGDADYIGSVQLTADVPATISGSGLTSALQAMIDGAECNFLIRRVDTDWETKLITAASLTVEFDLDCPPN